MGAVGAHARRNDDDSIPTSRNPGAGGTRKLVEVGWKAWMRQIEVAESEIRSRGR